MPVRVSVCMATYNGARFVVEQLRSILSELEADDEVVIVDDASTDDTVVRIRSLADDRIHLVSQDSNRGYVRTFEHALSLARGDILMLSDQDDVWIPGRRALFVEALAIHRAAASNLVILGSGAPVPSPVSGRPWRLPPDGAERGAVRSLRVLAGIQPYYGCAMAVRRDLVSSILPFPAFLHESHDLWIALVANAARDMCHIGEATVERRLHDSNASPSRPRGVHAVLRARWMLLRSIAEARRRVRASRGAPGSTE
ncbi:hypothetical protein HMPREF1529_00252 [Microbacterium sp. oral taxon 186 str. F0373]|nr:MULTISPECIES: glycosyltransferase [Microbacterium]EPD86723.1 hypothetical protein HMPREF1529_00252 [Microbacterium sp. oral taxon 186 str. F0373]